MQIKQKRWQMSVQRVGILFQMSRAESDAEAETTADNNMQIKQKGWQMSVYKAETLF